MAARPAFASERPPAPAAPRCQRWRLSEGLGEVGNSGGDEDAGVDPVEERELPPQVGRALPPQSGLVRRVAVARVEAGEGGEGRGAGEAAEGHLPGGRAQVVRVGEGDEELRPPRVLPRRRRTPA